VRHNAKTKTGTANHHIAGVPTSISALTHDWAPQPGTFCSSIA
jgi:hypothetical protein